MLGSQLAPGAPKRAQALTGKTLLFPVIGHPTSHVRAPAVFNALFKGAGVDALCVGLDLPPGDVVSVCRGLLASPSVGGLLVTVPYKKVLAEVADRLGASAMHVGAVNALRRAADGRIEGDLFDGLGFVRGLRAAGHEVAGRRVLLLGCGGAGSAIAAALADARVASLALFDPVAASVATLHDRLQRLFPGTEFESQETPEAAGCDFVVNASPLGLAMEDPLPMDLAGIGQATVVCDIIMEPSTTRFVKAARERGLPIHLGRHMLDQQVPAYLAFFDMPDLAARVCITADSISLQAG